MLTQSEGELVEPLQFGHQGADCVPGLLLQSEVAWVLDGLWARNTGRSADVTFKKDLKTLPISSVLSSSKQCFTLGTFLLSTLSLC